jgi:selenide, water dikinase
MQASAKDILFCKSGGCSAKLGAGLLRHVLEKLPKVEDKNLLVGFSGSDDAAVYQLSEDLAIVQTLDFFPPMVTDPYTFGQIAAANALSDIYAMGGEVKTALNIVCFPEKMDLNILGKILLGGSDKIHEAGGVVAGGHSIADEGVKYGLSVTGTIHPQKILKNNACKAGDVLILTKPLGVGIVTTANRVGQASTRAMDKAIESMTTLNKYAAEALRKYDVHACTDVTGFGFLGHLSEMIADTCSAVIYYDKIPYIEEAYMYAEEFLLTGAGQKNRNFVGDYVEFDEVPFPYEEILFDPQTSGGLLVAIHPKDAPDALKQIQALGLSCGIVGEIKRKAEIKIQVKKSDEEIER